MVSGIDFYRLIGTRRDDDVSFWPFDLLELDDKDLRDLPLTARKAHLSKLFRKVKGTDISMVPSFDDGHGPHPVDAGGLAQHGR